MTYACIPLPPSDMVTKVTKALLGVAVRSFVGWASKWVKRPFVTFVTVSLGVGVPGMAVAFNQVKSMNAGGQV